MFIILISVIIFLYLLHNYLYNGEKSKYLDEIPGPKIKFLFGNMIEAVKARVPFFYNLRSYINKHDGICRLRFPDGSLVMLYTPEDVELLLTSQKLITKESIYDFLHPWLGTGLLTSTGEKWQTRRKILTPSFHFNILKQFCKIFIEHSEHLVENLKKNGGQEVNILPYITDFTMNAICETAMGTNLDSTQKTAVEYKKAIYGIGETVIHRMTRLWLHSSLIFKFSSWGKKQNEELEILHRFTTDVIDERRKTRSEIGNQIIVEDYVDDDVVGNKKKRLAMLDLLLSAESEGKIDGNGIREEVDTFMFEGHDTTTMAIIYFLMLLANNPEAQQLAYEEIQKVLGDNATSIKIESLNELKYLERCIKESLRMYPSVPFFGRQLTDDLKLKNYLIPAGTACEVHVYDMHRNPKLYPNPEKFDPERFLPENCAKRHNFAYIPFSAGPRNCIGQKFAMLEIKTVVSIILNNFKLEAVTKPDDIIFFMDLVLRSQTPIKVKFLPRHV